MNIQEISKHLKTQDNRATDQPMFVVQEEVTDYGISMDYSDEYIWFDSEQEEHASDEEKAWLDELDADCEEIPEKWTKGYYRKRWEFVTACFTEQGCKDFLAINGHNHGKTRIHGWGTHRNKEYQAVRDYLMGRVEQAG